MYRLMIIADDGENRTMLTIGGSKVPLKRIRFPLLATSAILNGCTAAMNAWPKPCLLG